MRVRQLINNIIVGKNLMNFNIFHLRSLKTRVTLFTLAVFLIGIWLLAFYASRELREDMQCLLGEQQFSTVSFVAEGVNEELEIRLISLENIAKQVTSAILSNPPTLQELLEQRPILQTLFNGGITALSADGTTIADVPLSTGRIGINYMDRDHIALVLKEGKASIARPVIGRKLQAPILSITAPIRDAQGNVIGALIGVIDLGKPNFLDKITEGHYGKTGDYFLTAGQYRLIVTTSNKSRIMETLPAPGINSLIDRFIQGYEGTVIGVNPVGVEVLASAKGIPLTGWYAAVAQPTEEAFAPIRAMQQRILLTTIFMTILVVGLSWWMLRRLFSTMLAATKTLASMSDTNQPPQPLPISSQDEIGQLIGGFNHLIETLKQREEALRKSEERFRKLFEGHSVVKLIIDPDTGNIIDANESAADFYGWSIEELRQMRIQEINTLPPKTVKSEMAKVRPSDGLVFEFRHRRANGSIRDVEVFSNKIEITGKALLYSIIHDITKRKQAEAEKEKIEAQNRQLQKAESLGRMAGAIAHHFNNQLYAVMGNLEMAMDDLPLGVNSNESLIEAMQAARKAAEVSRLMLTYLGQTPGKSEPIDLSEACRQSLTLLRAAAPKGALINADFPSSGPVIRANAGQIQQVLSNLIINAWEAIGENGTIALTIRTVSHADIPISKRFPIDWQPQSLPYACLEVSDTGCGIADKCIEKIFDPFFTTKFTGRGLGLPVVLGIVKAYGGGITVESEPGRGSVFRVFLPVSTEELPCRPDLPTVPEALPTGKAEKFSKIEGGGTVLLIEDEDQVRNMAKIMLTRLGYTVLEAKDGIEAVVMFQQLRDEICCVLSDLTMPGMNGWETLAALRKLSPEIPVILSSGYDEAQVMAGEHPERPNAFLGKPYQRKGLSDTIRRVLANKDEEV